MKFRIISVVIFLSLAGIFGLMLYDVKEMNSETIILCASNDGGILIPSKVCEYYIYNYRDIKKDIEELSSGGGLAFILNGKNNKIKYKLAEFYILNGLNINGVNNFGNYNITPIHGAVLFNDVEMVEFLLKHGANVKIKPESINMTPLEFAISLQGKEPAINREKIIKILTTYK